MAQLMNYIFLLSFAQMINFAASNPGDCPFEDFNACWCNKDPSKPNVLISVICFPPDGHYTPVSGPAGTYVVTDMLGIGINGSTDATFPANAFAAFKSIKFLNINGNVRTSFRNLTLDPSAFEGPSIGSLGISNFQNLLPILPAVKNLGKNGLQGMSIFNIAVPKSLIAKDFADFRNLTTLFLGYFAITSISDDAFAGLENSLLMFQFEKVYIKDYPVNALNRLTKLADLQLSLSLIENFPVAAFTSLTNLKSLSISGAALQVALDSNALDNFPASVDRLYLTGGNLQQVPTSAIPLTVPWLDLNFNNITAVRRGDFPRGNTIRYLSLSYNYYLSEIEPGAFEELKQVTLIEIHRSALTSLDLVVFGGMDQLKNITMYLSLEMENVTVSDPEQVPATLDNINLSDCVSLHHADPSMQAIVDRDIFDLLDISYAINFICDDSTLWLAKYVLCDPKRVNTQSSVCVNLGKPLDEWLAAQVPNPCQ